MLTVNCIEKTKIEKKTGNGPFKKSKFPFKLRLQLFLAVWLATKKISTKSEYLDQL